MKYIVLLWAICFSSFAFAQSQDSLLIKKKNSNFLRGLPILYYLPETRFVFGAIGLASFNFKKDSINAFKSTVSLGFIYTQNKQITAYLPYNLFFKNGKYRLYGDASYYKFNYLFYGIGNTNPINYSELYDIEHPRLRLTFLMRIFSNLYGGLKYSFDNYTLGNFKEGGQLMSDTIFGSRGGVTSGVAAVFLYDSRNDNFFPTKGWFSELIFHRDDKLFGSSFNFNKLSIDVSKYFNFKNNIFAINYHAVFSEDRLPFFQMAAMGGIRYMRGFYEARYRDNNSQIAQLEFRRMFKNRFGFVVFGGVGQVNSSLSKFSKDNWRYTYGTGLRYKFSKNQNANLRLDFAIGNNKLLAYFTIGEAF